MASVSKKQVEALVRRANAVSWRKLSLHRAKHDAGLYDIIESPHWEAFKGTLDQCASWLLGYIKLATTGTKRSREARRAESNPTSQVDDVAAHELLLYVDNESDLAPNGPKGPGHQVAMNLYKKWKAGKYDAAKAPKGWAPIVEMAAKRYAKEFDDPRNWSDIFSAATRRQVAQEIATRFESQAKNGELEHLGRAGKNPAPVSTRKGKWTQKYKDSLPDSAFLIVDRRGGATVKGGRTHPLSRRHLPYKDKSGKVNLDHLRNAISRAPQTTSVPVADRKAAQERARKLLAQIERK